MKPAKSKLRKFRKNPLYTHHRSEGLTHRRNRGSAFHSGPARTEHPRAPRADNNPKETNP